MRDLALAGFIPIGIVYRDPSISDAHYLFEHNEIPEAVHKQLVEDAEAILGAAAAAVAEYSAYTLTLNPKTDPKPKTKPL
jgi:hypothetical protein